MKIENLTPLEALQALERGEKVESERYNKGGGIYIQKIDGLFMDFRINGSLYGRKPVIVLNQTYRILPRELTLWEASQAQASMAVGARYMVVGSPEFSIWVYGNGDFYSEYEKDGEDRCKDETVPVIIIDSATRFMKGEDE